MLLKASAGVPREVSVFVDGKPVQWTDARPFIDENNRTLVPLRTVADAMYLNVIWDPDHREARFSEGAGDLGSHLRFPIGSRIAYDDVWTFPDCAYDHTEEIQMDTAAVIVNDRTYAPIRYLSERFHHSVEWDAETRTVILEDTLRDLF